MPKKIVALVFVAVISFPIVLRADEGIPVSLVQLIATPQRFDGLKVIVVGFADLNGESSTLYLRQEDYLHRIIENGVPLVRNEFVLKNRGQFNRKYVKVTGIFKSVRNRAGVFAARIEEIREVVLWSDLTVQEFNGAISCSRNNERREKGSMSPRVLKRLIYFVMVGSLCFQSQSLAQNDLHYPTHRDQLPEGLKRVLLAHSEPPALNEHCPVTCYQLISRSNPTGTTAILRLEIREEGTARIFAKLISERGSLLEEKVAEVSQPDIKGFLDLVGQSGFWNLPPNEVEEAPFMKDGSTWTIEGAQNRAYHVVRRRQPKRSRYTEIGRCLAKRLANLDDSAFSVPE